MRGVAIKFAADGATLDFNSSVDEFMPTVQNAVVFVGQKLGSDQMRPEKGSNMLQNAVQGGLVTAGAFMQELQAVASEAREFSTENDDLNNIYNLEKFSLVLDEWLTSAARIKIGAKATTGEEILTEYILS